MNDKYPDTMSADDQLLFGLHVVIIHIFTMSKRERNFAFR
jgi:hypothetical protein